MKKLTTILIVFLFWTNPSFSFIKGKGELKFSDRALNHFVDYIHAEANFKKKNSNDDTRKTRVKPGMFIISSDGDWTGAWFCPYSQCVDPGSSQTIKECERETGVNCGVFAARRTIYWDNGINTKKNKARLKSSMTFDEIKNTLINLGFYDGGSITSTSNSNNSKDLAKKIKDLKKLYDDGILTKEEFEKAKKRVLDQ